MALIGVAEGREISRTEKDDETPETSRTLTAPKGYRLNPTDETFIAETARTLEARGVGTGQFTSQEGSLIAFSSQDYGQDAQEDKASTLRVAQRVAIAFETRFARNDRGGPSEVVSPLKAESGRTGRGDGAPCVAFSEYDGDVKTQDELAYTLTTGGGKPGDGYPAILQGEIEKSMTLENESLAFDTYNQTVSEKTQMLRAGGMGDQIPAISVKMQVRRLTPKECARLQGFPDDHLDIIYNGKPASDGPKYRALGNSMAVPVMRWIGQRIQMVQEILDDAQEKNNAR